MEPRFSIEHHTTDFRGDHAADVIRVYDVTLDAEFREWLDSLLSSGYSGSQGTDFVVIRRVQPQQEPR